MPVILEVPIDISPGANNVWESVDISAHVSASATGVIVKLNNNVASNRRVGVRNNGSIDYGSGPPDITLYGIFQCCGIDANKILECYRESTSQQVILLGYFETEATFLVNREEVEITLNAWGTRDISNITGGDTPVALLGKFVGQSMVREFGSTDERINGGKTSSGFICGTTPNGLYQARRSANSSFVYVYGYLTSGYTSVGVNTTNVTPSLADTWEDLPALPAGAVMGIYEGYTLGITASIGARAKGDLEEIVTRVMPANHNYAFGRCDAARIVQGIIGDAGYSMNLHGYLTSGGPEPEAPKSNALFFGQD